MDALRKSIAAEKPAAKPKAKATERASDRKKPAPGGRGSGKAKSGGSRSKTLKRAS